MRASAFTQLKTLGLVDWGVLAFGWSHQLLSADDVADFAAHETGTQHEARESLLLATQDNEPEKIGSQLNELAAPVVSRLAADKWRLAHLMEIADLKADWDTKVTMLEDVYSEFGYPEDMRECSRYGGARDPLDAMAGVIAALRFQAVKRGSLWNR